MDVDRSKRCTGCGRVLPTSEYHHTTSTRDGLHTRCRACRATTDRALYVRQRSDRLAHARTAYAADPEKFRARVRRAYREDAEYREACKARTAARSRRAHARRNANPVTRFADRLRERLWHALRARGLPKRGRTWALLGYTSVELRERLLPFLGQPCEACGGVILTPDNVHLDHVRPLAVATTEVGVLALNTLSNLRLICGPCNLRKHARVEASYAAS